MVAMFAAAHIATAQDPDLVATEQAAEFERAAAPERLEAYVDQFRSVVDALRVGDVRAAMEARMDPDEWAREQYRWEERRKERLQELAEQANAEAQAKSDSASSSEPKAVELHHDNPLAELEPYWAMLRTPEGTEAFIAEWQPKLAELGNQKVIEFNLGIAVMLQGIQQDQNMTAEEIAQANEFVLALQRWANSIDWNDGVRFRTAVAAVADAVRASKLEHLRDAETLSYDDAMEVANTMFRAGKRVMAAYDLDVDPVLTSVQINVVNQTPTRATMVITLRALDVPLAFTQELAYVDGNWLDARVAEYMAESDAAAENVQITVDKTTVQEVEPDARIEPPAKAQADAAQAEVPARHKPTE
jgi:hypothetical protein